MIKRFFLLFFLHILAISLILITHPKAEESEWYVKEFGNYIITGVNGEVSHGDRLRFAIKKNDCERMSILFSFSTTKRPLEVKKLQDERIPIRFNDREAIAVAEIIAINTLGEFMSIVMMQAPGFKNIREMVGALMIMYRVDKNFSIELINEDGFKADYYFDILKNNWKLDLLPSKIKQAQNMCYGPDKIKSS